MVCEKLELLRWICERRSHPDPYLGYPSISVVRVIVHLPLYWFITFSGGTTSHFSCTLSLSLVLFGLLQAVAWQVQFQNDAVMNQAVNGSRRGHGVFKNLLPLGKGQIACQHHRATLIAIRQQRKEHLHLFATVLNITDIINDKGMISGEPFQHPGKFQVPFGN